jgi:hypothetical protein
MRKFFDKKHAKNVFYKLLNWKYALYKDIQNVKVR